MSMNYWLLALKTLSISTHPASPHHCWSLHHGSASPPPQYSFELIRYLFEIAFSAPSANPCSEPTWSWLCPGVSINPTPSWSNPNWLKHVQILDFLFIHFLTLSHYISLCLFTSNSFFKTSALPTHNSCWLQSEAIPKPSHSYLINN